MRRGGDGTWREGVKRGEQERYEGGRKKQRVWILGWLRNFVGSTPMLGNRDMIALERLLL